MAVAGALRCINGWPLGPVVPELSSVHHTAPNHDYHDPKPQICLEGDATCHDPQPTCAPSRYVLCDEEMKYSHKGRLIT